MSDWQDTGAYHRSDGSSSIGRGGDTIIALSVMAIDAAKGRAKPCKLTDSDGLYLSVTSAGGRYWRINDRHLGKQKTIEFGAWPDATRDRRDAARKMLARGDDSAEQDPIAASVAASDSFKAVADEWLAKVEIRRHASAVVPP